MTEPLHLSADAPVPLYQQLKSWLITGIHRGRWQPDTPLPSERTLASEMAVSRATVRTAIDALVREGWVLRRHGSGTFVAPLAGELPLPRPDDFDDAPPARDDTPAAILLSARIEEPSRSVARALDLGTDELVTVVTRLHRIDGKPLLVERIHLPHALTPGLLEHDLTGSLYHLLARIYRLEPSGGEETVAVAKTKRWVAKALGMKKRRSVLRAERIVRDRDGRAIEFVRRYARADRCGYRVRLDSAGDAEFVMRRRRPG